MRFSAGLSISLRLSSCGLDPCTFFSGSNRATRRNHFDNEETEILVIPDLEDEGEEDVVLKGKLE